MINDNPIKVLIVDDHEVILDGLEAYLEEISTIWVIERASNAKDAMLKLKSSSTLDLVILDVNLPDQNGIELTKQIVNLDSNVNILAYSLHRQVEFVKQIINSGAKGYVLKTSSKAELTKAIKQVIGGGHHLDSALDSQLEINKTETGFEIIDKKESNQELTKREKEIARLIGLGKSTDYISETLFISTHTVNNHRKNILFKIQGKNAADIALYALKTGILAKFDVR